MVTLLYGAWLALLAGAAMALRPRCRRLDSFPSDRSSSRSRPPIGERLAGLLAFPRWQLSATRRSQLALAVPVAVIGLFVWPPMAPALALVAWAVPLRRRRARVRAGRREIIRDLPDVVDLFTLAFAADLNLRLALEAVARSGRGAIVERFAGALHQADHGQRLHEAVVATAAELGDPVRPLLRVLADTAASPAEMRSQLAVVGVDARHERRRAAEAAARQVPVRLLFPLVVAVLPAFGLLTVVPIVAGSLQSVGG